MDILNNAKNHFSTITRHRHEVMKNCFRAGIGMQGLFHDLSKYSPTEFIPGIIYFQGTRSPNESERENKGYSKAWMHHKGRNKHHYEYWTDYNPKTKSMEGVEMPARYFVEMVCDRIAASKIYYGSQYNDSASLNYYLGRKGKILMHPKTQAELEKVLRMLSKKGEKVTFRYLRKLIRNSRESDVLRKVSEWI
ncbi:MAG: DUF5662 family protein [Butyrivibrio sp.]